MTEKVIEQALIEKLGDLKYSYRQDICDRVTLEQNFRKKFEVLNRVHLTEVEFSRLLEQIVTSDVFAAARHLREHNSFERDNGTPLIYTLVNNKDWCKNTFEVVNQLRINTDSSHFSFNAEEQFLPLYQFAGKDNKKITHLDSFAENFLAKCTLGQMISRYMVLVACEQKLMMMRPYQIYAVKAIVECIKQNSGNGYIWHTTGSGKTLTSFKASTLLKDNKDIEKCLFVVDRKDLDRQTREEFNKFQEGCVEENTNTEALVQRLLSDDYADKVIVTTIQKLGLALDDSNKRNYKKRLEPLSQKRIVFIFDECHRSQFGENHKAIKEFFLNAQLFGFTGTPIFEQNASYQQIEGEQASYKTTEDIFQQELHSYTITDAIEDRNVLRFHIDYFKPKGKNKPTSGEALAKKAIVEAILEKHDKTTGGRRFNAILATSSINDAIAYHGLFKTMQAKKQTKDSNFQPLNVACVFSPPAEGNKDVQQIQEDLPQEKADNQVAPDEKKEALKAIIAEYNIRYGTNHDINTFDLYYQDVQTRIKDQKYPNQDLPHDQKIDLVIVVDMLLTGFDSKFLNTLYVDKNLKYHGLIQAFSRTNRVLNDTKPYGSILDFRQQQQAVDEAITLFSGEHKEQAKEIWLVDPAPAVINKLTAAVTKLDEFMQSQGLTYAPEEVANLKGDAARGQLIGLIQSDAKFMDDREDIAAYIGTLKAGEGLDEKAIRQGYEAFKTEMSSRELAEIATKHGLKAMALQAFVDGILRRMIFDGEQLSDLLAPLELGWKARTRKELALMEDLIPLLHKLAQGREISGLGAYEQ